MSRARVTRATQARAARDERRLIKQTQDAHHARTADSYQNFALQLGIGTSNALSQSTYGFNPITRVRTLLEWIHRGSWLGGVAVDVPADDMTREGVDIHAGIDPEATDDLQAAMVDLGIWTSLGDGTRWGGLYGGAIGVHMIDGQDVSTPLRVETVGPGKYRGLLILDRWMVDAQLTDLVTEMGPSIGKPQWYKVNSDAPCFHGKKIHYSRVIRFEGVKVPYWQRVMENLWGISVYERLYDRMVAFDSATQGAAQLVYKSFIRTYKLEGLRDAIATGGPAEQGIVKQVEMMRRFQSNEGITLLDGKDEFAAHSSSGFTGIGDVLIQFGQQLSGALQIPLTRLFGQSPAGLNSTGESDLRTYYDGIKQRQNREYRLGLKDTIRMTAQSEGIKLDENFSFEFRPLWQLTEQQKSEVAQRDAQTVESVEGAGLISQQTALKELRQHSKITGRFTNITDEDIDAADDEVTPPDMAEAGGLVDPETGEPIGGEKPGEEGRAAKPGEHMLKPKRPPSGGGAGEPKEPKSAGDRARTRDELRELPDRHLTVAGLPITIETPRGAVRAGSHDDGREWSVVMPADYGYFRGTGSAEGSAEELDCFVGPHHDSRDVWIVDTLNPSTGEFDEHKLMLGFRSQREALDCFRAAYEDGTDTPPSSRVGGVTRMSADELRLRDWIYGGDKTRPLAQPPRLVAAR